MNNKAVKTVVLAAGLSAAALGLAVPVPAAPSGSVGNAQDTIASLEDQGYRVVVNRRSLAPLSAANVVSVSEGPAFIHNVAADGSSSAYSIPVATRTVYVNVR